tara:strand:+ start:87 stop:251 length:165 start_codon:yes stop_codon:yes gene_type:complete
MSFMQQLALSGEKGSSREGATITKRTCKAASMYIVSRLKKMAPGQEPNFILNIL